MSFKEFFSIEPIQKNGLLIFAFTSVTSYIQLVLFKTDFLTLELFDKIILSMSVSVFWIVGELPTYFFFMRSRWQKWKQKGEVFHLIPDRIVTSFGFTTIIWSAIITYIGYEFEMNMKTFVRFSLLCMFIKSLFWFVFFLKHTLIDNKQRGN